MSVRGRVYGVYAQNGITSCGVGLMSGSVSGGRAADRRDGGGRYVCEYHHAPQNVVTLHSFQDRWACVCSAAVPECLRSEYANAFRGPLMHFVGNKLRDAASLKASRTAPTDRSAV